MLLNIIRKYTKTGTELNNEGWPGKSRTNVNEVCIDEAEEIELCEGDCSSYYYPQLTKKEMLELKKYRQLFTSTAPQVERHSKFQLHD